MFLVDEKKGYKTNQLGGSADSDGATTNQLNYFQEHRGSFPSIAGAIYHLSKKMECDMRTTLLLMLKARKRWSLFILTAHPNQGVRSIGKKNR
jgi:hypothetical protein